MISHSSGKKSSGMGLKIDMDTGKRWLQLFMLILEFLLMGLSLWPAFWLFLKLGSDTDSALQLVLTTLLSILVFNYAYLILLLLLRIVIPVPKEGFYQKTPDGGQPREVLIYMLNIILVLLRYRPPWAAYISSLLVNIFPLHYFYRRYFGPDTSSTTLGDTYMCTDPFLVKAGKNVQFGGFSLIAAHSFDQRGMILQKTEIGDNSVIGARAFICAGAKIGRNSIIGSGSMVLPGTVIGDNEFWAGVPAKKIKDLPSEL